MPAEHHIRNPFEMTLEQLSSAARSVGHAALAPTNRHAAAPPQIRRIGLDDLRQALREAVGDLGANRTDVLFLCLIYPIAGLVLARLAFSYDLLPMIFPLASGFAILGPLAAIGLYEISRRRERGEPVSWDAAFSVLRSPALGGVLGLGALLVVIFGLWLAAAYGIYQATLGPAPPTSLSSFLRDVFQTSAGWAMIVVGLGVGFLFAVAALAISVVSFPLMLDRDVSLGAAVATSVRAVLANPVTMAVWGAIVAAALVLGSIPALVGLVFVMPVLGHATWRLYRRLVA